MRHWCFLQTELAETWWSNEGRRYLCRQRISRRHGINTECGQTMSDNEEITRCLLSESTPVNRQNSKWHTGLVYATDFTVLSGLLVLCRVLNSCNFSIFLKIDFYYFESHRWQIFICLVIQSREIFFIDIFLLKIKWIVHAGESIILLSTKVSQILISLNHIFINKMPLNHWLFNICHIVWQ